ncbi:coagulase domain-containing protein [Staphylococcus hyicus]|uniref:coagulase domain-containing protein n=2 Tax=Staphylococcus hyicus TaxID=1284 RepID=UPI00273A2378|nr:coagulase domain-containing protein [Staphylococcus hyicus]MDP4448468.1 coagulase domain-containing protein [Staphylococcus hyicus]MDP4469291.1 coagulase domain-containing protein [Staphylococcus hyicus]
MKKKLLVLSASAILASNFIFDNNASAVVSKNDIKSDALSVNGKIKRDISLQDYQDSIDRLILRLSVNPFGGFDQPEYKKAYERYQKQYIAELDALNKFISEDVREPKYIRKYDNAEKPKGLGLTHERYEKIYENLKQNKNRFLEDVDSIEASNEDLKRFSGVEQENALEKVYTLEDKALMVRRAFRGYDEYKEARSQLYNKLYLIVGSNYDERLDKLPTNKRMLDEMCEDLETIIDEFFKDIKLERPLNIERISAKNQDDVQVLKKVREDAQKAKYNESFRDPGVKERAEKLQKENKKAKAEREAKAKELKEKGLLRGKAFTPQNYPLYFSHKKLKDHSQSDSKNELVFKETNEQPKELQTYTESITQTPQPVLKQQKREETFTLESAPHLNQSKPLNGLNGESHFVTMDESSNASTQFGSNGHVFEYSFDSTPKTTNVTKQNVKQENYNSVNNLAGMSGESQHVDFTQDSHPTTTYGGYGNAFDLTEDTAPKQPETITESHEIVLDYQTHATMSGFKTGVSTEAYYSSNELTK